MKQLCALLLSVLFIHAAHSQQAVRCQTMHADSVLRAKYSLESLGDFENWLQAKIAQYKASPANGARAVITIPVIVHVIHNGDAVGTNENISQAQVNSQFDVLNEDYRKAIGTLGYNTNAVGADCEIEWCPALIDPNGNVLAEPGIDRQNMGQASWEETTADATLKPATSWDPTRYCNIWTVNFGGTSASLLGYAQLPSSSGLQGLNTNGGAANTDGVVIRYTAFGRVGNVATPYHKGRTATHELGHWLGLRHIWGDQNCGNDYCNDTPTSAAANFGCPTGQNTCPDAGNDMVENYMDYTDDLCMNIFTLNQKDRMVVVMNNSPRRNSLLSSNVCTIPFTFPYTGRVVDASNGQGIPNAKVWMDGATDYTPTTDANGYFTIANLQQANYTAYAGKWGYVTASQPLQAYTPATPQITISLQSGYYDDFTFDFAWTATSSATTGAWVRGVPVGTTYNSNQSNPGADVTGDFSNQCYVTGNGGGGAGDDDVDAGTVTLTSPAMNLTTYTNPSVRYYRWFFNSGGSGTPNDSLVISLVNGTTVIDIDKVGQGANSNQWTYKSYRVKDYIANPGNNIYFRARTFDQATTGHLVEGGIDLFRVIDSSGVVSQPPVANYGSNSTEVCAGGQVTFNDLSSNTPTSWTWLFAGGTPPTSNSPNPVITYNTPGVYDVILTVSNNGGTNSVTQSGFIHVNPVVAQFSQDKAAVCPGQSVTFANESSCNPTSLKWIFTGGDITTTTSDTATVIYTAPGFYDVTLIASNHFGSDTLIQNLAVQVYDNASVNATSIPDTNNLGEGTATVSVSGGVGPYSYSWSDAQHQTTQTATGLAAGTYTATVTDLHGCTSITSVVVENVVLSGIASVNTSGISVYPNPLSSGKWKVQASEEWLGRELVLSDISGRIIMKKAITSAVTAIAAESLASGVYFLKVSETGEVMRLVKE